MYCFLIRHVFESGHVNRTASKLNTLSSESTAPFTFSSASKFTGSNTITARMGPVSTKDGSSWVRVWQLSLSRLKMVLRLLSSRSRMATLPYTSSGHCKPPLIPMSLTEKICKEPLTLPSSLSVKRAEGIFVSSS
uniref:Uncharacterized protein n=1 Tax=Arundo donax TaxID=35708 RepID=A0A0A9DFI9_ARUDO